MRLEPTTQGVLDLKNFSDLNKGYLTLNHNCQQTIGPRPWLMVAKDGQRL